MINVYVGSTTDHFVIAGTTVRVEHMQADLFEHFTSNGHNGFLEDCTITLIDKTADADPTRREEYWRRVLKTVPPYGSNSVA